MKSAVYLDNAAATPTDRTVVEAMKPFYDGVFGNPSSAHQFGRQAAEAIEQSQKTIAEFLGAKATEIFFTGSGTESNNLALVGIAKANRNKGRHIITTTVEHPSILNACRALEKDGFDVTYLPVDSGGLVNSGDLRKALRKETILVSIHLANSEIGVIQPITNLATIIRKNGTYFHTDACQAVAYIPINVETLGVDLLTFNGSKCYGPKGVGVLYVRQGVDIFPIHYGGGQQQGLRSGTENVQGIVGLAQAAMVVQGKWEEESVRIARLRNRLQAELEKLGAVVNAKASLRLPNHLSVILPINETDVVKYFDKHGVAISSGSACSSKSLTDSHVLRAIGLDSQEIQKTARITLGYQTSDRDIEKVIKLIQNP